MNISGQFKKFHLSSKMMKRKLVIGAVFAALFLVLGVTALISHTPPTEDQRFRTFTNQIFLTELSGSTLNLHYTLADPSSYGLKQYPITLGSMGKASHLASSAQVENYLSTLGTFTREQLSAENLTAFISKS